MMGKNIMKKGTLAKCILSLREKKANCIFREKLNFACSTNFCYQLTGSVICGIRTLCFTLFYLVMKTQII